VGVYETGPVLVRRAVASAGDDVLPGDRFAGGAMPLLPLLRGVWFPIGVEEQVLAEHATPALQFEQEQGAAVQRGLVPASPFGSVVGQGGVVG
jgi:hypothetical protein